MASATLRLRRLYQHFVADCSETRTNAWGVDSCTCAAVGSRIPVALILGAGAGIGQGVARRFAREGYHVVVVRRGEGPNRLLRPQDDSKQRLEDFADSIRQSGGRATALFADGTVPEEVAALLRNVEETIGPIHFVNYNIGAQVGDRALEATSYKIFEVAWRLGALGAFAIAKEVAEYMAPRGQGTIIYTSATAAFRGRQQQHAHTAAMGARRMLTQSLAAELGPKGIHIVHVNIDGVVNAPETFGEFVKRAGGPDAFAKVLERLQASEEIVEPDAVADTYYHLHKQPRGVWTQELDLKPWTTKAWFSNAEGSSPMTRLPDAAPQRSNS